MARKRFVSPAFFKHADLFDAEVETGLPLRLGFAALWCQADRRGLFAWKPRELKTDCLPYDECDFGDVLNALHAYGFVISYEVNGKRYGGIPSFGDHQSFHVAEKPDRTLPEPSQDGAKTVPVPSKHGASTVSARCKHGASTPVAVTTTVAVTDAVTGAVTGRAKTSKGEKPEPKFPRFPLAARQECYAYWVKRMGPVDFVRLVLTVGPHWRPDDPNASMLGFQDYCGLATQGFYAPKAGIVDLGEKLTRLIQNASRHASDPIGRVQGAEIILHGKAAA